MKDKNGETVCVGDLIRVLALPKIPLDENGQRDVDSMLGAEFEIEQIQNDTVEITKWFGQKNGKYCHSLFLWSNEFELVKV